MHIENGENSWCKMLVNLYLLWEWPCSNLVSEPCNQFCFCIKLYPKHVQNFIEHCKLYIRVHTCKISVHTAFLTKNHRKNTHKTRAQFLCLPDMQRNKGLANP